jgi:hypothetical protein
MKTDRYTKAVLTVIAVCLVCLVTQKDLPLLPTANAATVNQTGIQEVRIVGVRGKSSGWNSLPVKIQP